jgi:hypothetical protein
MNATRVLLAVKGVASFAVARISLAVPTKLVLVMNWPVFGGLVSLVA